MKYREHLKTKNENKFKVERNVEVRQYPSLILSCEKKLLRKHGITSSVQIKLVRLKLCDLKPYKNYELRKNSAHLRTKRRWTPTVSFKCSFSNCSFKTLHIDSLKMHERIHTGEKPYKCKVCGWSARYHCIKQHMRVHHPNILERTRKFNCELCTYAAYTAEHLKLHMRTHTDEKPYKCEYCTKTFRQRTNLNGHLKTHTKVKPYPCTLCNYSAISSTVLNIHMRLHTGERPFACSQCEYRASQSTHLKRHVQTHHSNEVRERKFPCLSCSDTFYTRPALESHSRRHTGEKPYKCKFCLRGFSQIGAKNVHENKRCKLRKI